MWLHIYGQKTWHDAVLIVGNPEALTALRDALDAALKGENPSVPMFDGSGEGYEVVLSCEDRDEAWEEMRLPYPLPGLEDNPPGKMPRVKR